LELDTTDMTIPQVVNVICSLATAAGRNMAGR